MIQELNLNTNWPSAKWGKIVQNRIFWFPTYITNRLKKNVRLRLDTKTKRYKTASSYAPKKQNKKQTTTKKTLLYIANLEMLTHLLSPTGKVHTLEKKIQYNQIYLLQKKKIPVKSWDLPETAATEPEWLPRLIEPGVWPFSMKLGWKLAINFNSPHLTPTHPLLSKAPKILRNVIKDTCCPILKPTQKARRWKQGCKPSLKMGLLGLRL